MSIQIHTAIETRPSAHLSSAAVYGLLAGYFGILSILFYQHKWVLAPGGKPIASDFIAYWGAGLTTLSGHAIAAYDLAAQHALHVSLAGQFQGYYYWTYPPPFFFVVAVLGCLPFLWAFFLWTASTGAGFAFAIGRIATRNDAVAFACASPAVLINAYVGQGGFLTAALLGAGLLALPRRPLLGGLLFGLMAYKPQLGILIPLALIAYGSWAAIGSACATVLIASAAAALAFGTGSYAAFLHALTTISQTYLTHGAEGWSRIESFYSIARFTGAVDGIAWLAQAAAILVCAGAVIWLWRRQVPYALKAAGLIVAAMLSTPYLHEYDFPVLLMAFAFVYRDCPFDRTEWVAVAAANLLMAAFLLQLAPIGPIIILIAGAIVLRRLTVSPPSAVAVS